MTLIPDAPPIAARRQASGRLLRVLGVAFGLAVIIGNTIAAGILRTPGEIAAQLPSPGLFLGAWILGGIYALFGALSLAELGAMTPRSGGQYVFVRRALGEYPGFVVGWSDWISTCGSTAAAAMVIGEYTEVLVPALGGGAAAIAVGVAVAFAALQWRGIRWGDRTQQITSLAKALALVVLIAACFLAPGVGAGAGAPLAAPAGLALMVALTVALQGVIVTYDGWTGVLYFAEEVRDPGRDIPRSMLAGVLTVIAIYLLINLAFLHVLPMSRVAGEPFVAGAAAEALFGARGDRVLRVLMIVALLSSVNALQLIGSRVPYAMARDGLFPVRASGVNPGGTPTAALFAGTAVAILFVLTGTFNQVLAVLAFCFVLNYTLSFASVFVLRRREPDAPRPYRAWGYPLTTGLALLGSVAYLVASVAGDPRNSARAILVLALSYPVFRVAVKARGRAE